jgi:hypothetical protein
LHNDDGSRSEEDHRRQSVKEVDNEKPTNQLRYQRLLRTTTSEKLYPKIPERVHAPVT